jgi:hypothetical protein
MRSFRGSIVMAVIGLSAPALADGPAGTWGCECRRYLGSEDGQPCYMFANVTGKTFSFGAFETSGDGRFRVTRRTSGYDLTARIRTAVTGARMRIRIRVERSGDARVYIDNDSKPIFLAACDPRPPR